MIDGFFEVQVIVKAAIIILIALSLSALLKQVGEIKESSLSLVSRNKVKLDLLERKNIDEALRLCNVVGNKIDLMNVAGRSIELPWPFSCKDQIDNELVFFPGSFNPWHRGHLECLIKCPKKPIVVIPDHNPWKEVREHNLWDDVLNIYENIKSFEGKNVFIYPGFLSLKDKNPTSTWLPKVNVKSKWLLMGDDLFLGLHRWFEVHEIFNCLTGIYVCPRGATKTELQIQKRMHLEGL